MDNKLEDQSAPAGESQLHQVLTSAFSPLESGHPFAFEILLSKVQEGFFDTRQTRRPLSRLAEQLLETISVQGEDNAHQGN